VLCKVAGWGAVLDESRRRDLLGFRGGGEANRSKLELKCRTVINRARGRPDLTRFGRRISLNPAALISNAIRILVERGGERRGDNFVDSIPGPFFAQGHLPSQSNWKLLKPVDSNCLLGCWTEQLLIFSDLERAVFD
jgi:hypothetical protein